MTYRAYQLGLHHGPLRGPYGTAWAEELGATKDDLLDRSKEAVKVGFIGICADDALAYHGTDYNLERVASDTDTTYRARLVAAWDLWAWSGTERGVQQALVLVGLRGVMFFTASQSRWDRFCPTPLWARFRVVATGRYSWGEATWGAFTWGAMAPDAVQPLRWGAFRWGARVWGLDTTRAFVDAFLVQLAKWKNARERVHSVSFTFGGAVWGRFVWGSSPWGGGTDWPVTITQPTVWGSITWGRFTWGVPEQLF